MIPGRHADDAVGRAAQEVAHQALTLVAELYAAAADRPRAERAEALIKAFTAWPKICRRMAVLEQLAPASAITGAEADARTQDAIERIADRKATEG
jgi:hypothetical protein